jgi:hypothetical protein
MADIISEWQSGADNRANGGSPEAPQPTWICGVHIRMKDRYSFLEILIVCVAVCLVVAFFVFAWMPNYVRGGTSPANTCINNLRQIEAAKEEWAMVNGKTNCDVVTTIDITPYIQLNSNSQIPGCPAGGIYTIGRIGELPTCSLGTNASQPHVLVMSKFLPQGSNSLSNR